MSAQAEIAVSVECAAWVEALPEAAAVARDAGRAALAGAAGQDPTLPVVAELSLVLADDALVRRLNGQYRHQDKATNVLSFPAWQRDARASEMPTKAPVLLGDAIIAFETTRREAAARDLPLAHHLAHLVVHGTLHLLGYDHIEDAEAERMERLEANILRGLGIPDPYQVERGAPPGRLRRAKVTIHGR
ncbi:MAG TPA: rRNA maturation RNase YbeY [Alphaproteobacteria bacterium]|nr:rRNA maturation RNase YbeY [Alphaproteobacteria bacterium]